MMKTVISLALVLVLLLGSVSLSLAEGRRYYGGHCYQQTRHCGRGFNYAPMRYVVTPRIIIRPAYGYQSHGQYYPNYGYVQPEPYPAPVYPQYQVPPQAYSQPQADAGYDEVEPQTAPPVVTYPALSGPSEQGLDNIRREQERHQQEMLVIKHQREEWEFRASVSNYQHDQPPPAYIVAPTPTATPVRQAIPPAAAPILAPPACEPKASVTPAAVPPALTPSPTPIPTPLTILKPGWYRDSAGKPFEVK